MASIIFMYLRAREKERLTRKLINLAREYRGGSEEREKNFTSWLKQVVAGAAGTRRINIASKKEQTCLFFDV